MKSFRSLLAVLSLVAVVTTSAQSQFVIGSYERTQPFLYCGDTPVSELFTAPFSYTNQGTDVVTVDSMIASGDTSDFNAHYNSQTASFYLNPIALNTVVNPKSASIHGIGFQPTTLGDKQLIITAYYRVRDSAMTTVAIWRFHTASASPGLGFLTLIPDTISFLGTTDRQVVYDRTVSTDTIFRYFRARVGDSVGSTPYGMYRIDLTSCGSSTISDIRIAKDREEDRFVVSRPIVPKVLGTADSTLVDFTYIPLSLEPRIRTATATFVGSSGEELVLHLTIETLAPSSVALEELYTGGIGLETSPNPAHNSLTLHYRLSRAGSCQIGLTDLLGRNILTIPVAKQMEAGDHTYIVPLQTVVPGYYLLHLESDGSRMTRSVVVE